MNPESIILVDFHCCFFPAARLLLSGQSPYMNKGFFNPPWVLYPILPLTMLPEWLASWIWVVANLAIIFYGLALAASILEFPKSRATVLIVAALTISPFSFAAVFTGQLSSFVLLGLSLSFASSFGWVAPALLLIKPQIGLVPSLVWFWRVLLDRDWAVVLLAVFLPVALFLPAQVLAPDTLESFIDNLLGGRFYSIAAEYITAPYQVLGSIGLPEELWLAIAGIAIWAVYKRPTLPMVANASLLIIPYARACDNVLLLVPTLFFIKKRRHLWIVIPLICLPLFRLLIPPINEFWVDGLAPIGMFALLIWDYGLLRAFTAKVGSFGERTRLGGWLSGIGKNWV